MNHHLAFVVHLPSRPELRAQFLDELLPVLTEMSREPDFVNTYLHQSVEDSDTFVLYETWSCTKEHFLAHHLDKPYRQAFEARLPSMLKSPRRIEFLEHVMTFLST